jgi:hypothetical protein
MDVAGRLVEKLGWSGVAHIDLRLRSKHGTLSVLEINGRYWRTLLGSLRACVNFPMLACQALIGAPTSSRQVRQTRYFAGIHNAVSSLFGGGRNRIRPSETDLSYFVRDPFFWVLTLIAEPVKFFRDKVLRPAAHFASPRPSDRKVQER